MAYNKRTWVGRQGTGLNKFSINGATPVTVINQPDSITEQTISNAEIDSIFDEEET